MDCRLQVFKFGMEERSVRTTYRFAVVDYSRSSSYPANFVCMLPAHLDLVKGKSTNVFVERFGEKSMDVAKQLLKKALESESDAEVKSELERRLELLEPKQTGTVECSECKRSFHPLKVNKYKQYFCRYCYKKRFNRKC